MWLILYLGRCPLTFDNSVECIILAVFDSIIMSISFHFFRRLDYGIKYADLGWDSNLITGNTSNDLKNPIDDFNR